MTTTSQRPALPPLVGRALRRTRARAQRRSRRPAGPLLVWDGTEGPLDPHGVAVARWLEANGIDPGDIPVRTTITVTRDRIRYTAWAGRNGPWEQRTAPLITGWLPGGTR